MPNYRIFIINMDDEDEFPTGLCKVLASYRGDVSVAHWKESDLLAQIKRVNPHVIVLTGSKYYVEDENAPTIPLEIFRMKRKILGICYGFQLMVKLLGGELGSYSHMRDYRKVLGVSAEDTSRSLPAKYLYQIPRRYVFHHRDYVRTVPAGWDIHLANIGERCCNEIYASQKRNLYGIQFHPEKSSTTHEWFALWLGMKV